MVAGDNFGQAFPTDRQPFTFGKLRMQPYFAAGPAPAGGVVGIATSRTAPVCGL